MTTRVPKGLSLPWLSSLDKFWFYKGLLLHRLIPITYILKKLALHLWTAYMNDGPSKVPSTHQLIFMGYTKLLNFVVQKIMQWLNFSHVWLTQRLVVSGTENLFDFKEFASAHCFTKHITYKIQINTAVISLCNSNVVAWQKNHSYEILQFFQCYFELPFILVSIGWSHEEITQWEERLLSQTKSTSSIQRALCSLEKLPVHFYLDQNLKMFVFAYATSAISHFFFGFLSILFLFLRRW